MNIIEERRRKAWNHAAKVIFNKVTKEAAGGTLYIYADRIYGKGCYHRLTPDGALDTVFDTMGVLKEAWERDRAKPTKERFAEACPDKAIGAVVMRMWRDPFRYWNGRS